MTVFCERFFAAIERAEEDDAPSGIGSLAEKGIHRVLKYYFEPRREFHEISFRGFVADIKNDDGIVEIQTRSFDRLKEKLSSYLPDTKVVLVYPVLSDSEIVWIDPTSGEIVSSRKKSRKGRASDVLYELSKISEFVSHPNFTLRLVYMRCTDYRLLDGYGKDKKKRATKLDRKPTELLGIEDYRCPADYLSLLPDSLPVEFSSRDFEKATALRGIRLSFALSFSLKAGLVLRIGKEKNAYIYRINVKL